MGGRRGPPLGRMGNRPKGYQLHVSSLPPTGSWQDLKDHFRQAGDVVFTDVYKDGTGIVEYSRYEHMKRALRDLDDSKFRSHEVYSFICFMFLSSVLRSLTVFSSSFLGRNCLHPCEGSTSFPQPLSSQIFPSLTIPFQIILTVPIPYSESVSLSFQVALSLGYYCASRHAHTLGGCLEQASLVCTAPHTLHDCYFLSTDC